MQESMVPVHHHHHLSSKRISFSPGIFDYIYSIIVIDELLLFYTTAKTVSFNIVPTIDKVNGENFYFLVFYY